MECFASGLILEGVFDCICLVQHFCNSPRTYNPERDAHRNFTTTTAANPAETEFTRVKSIVLVNDFGWTDSAGSQPSCCQEGAVLCN